MTTWTEHGAPDEGVHDVPVAIAGVHGSPSAVSVTCSPIVVTEVRSAVTVIDWPCSTEHEELCVQGALGGPYAIAKSNNSETPSVNVTGATGVVPEIEDTPEKTMG